MSFGPCALRVNEFRERAKEIKKIAGRQRIEDFFI
jgi:hypothetical protein